MERMKRILVVKNHFINYHLQYFVFAYAVPSTKILTRRKNIDLALFFLWFAICPLSKKKLA